MSSSEKQLKRIFERPVRSDITLEEIKALASSFGLTIKTGGEHPVKIYFPKTKKMLVIPDHGKTVKQAYVREFGNMLKEEIEEM